MQSKSTAPRGTNYNVASTSHTVLSMQQFCQCSNFVNAAMFRPIRHENWNFVRNSAVVLYLLYWLAICNLAAQACSATGRNLRKRGRIPSLQSSFNTRWPSVTGYSKSRFLFQRYSLNSALLGMRCENLTVNF